MSNWYTPSEPATGNHEPETQSGPPTGTTSTLAIPRTPPTNVPGPQTWPIPTPQPWPLPTALTMPNTLTAPPNIPQTTVPEVTDRTGYEPYIPLPPHAPKKQYTDEEWQKWKKAVPTMRTAFILIIKRSKN